MKKLQQATIKVLKKILDIIVRKILCLIGRHEYEKQKDPFGFGDEIDTCIHCTHMKDVSVTYIKIR